MSHLPDVMATDDMKSETKAERARQAGNQMFGKKKYMDALRCYNEAVTQAPAGRVTAGKDITKKSELALALANRSAVLFELSMYAECLTDIQYAIVSGYPSNTMYKLINRKAKCLLNQGRHLLARETFQAVLISLDVANLDENAREKWKQNVTKQLHVIKSLESQTSNQTDPQHHQQYNSINISHTNTMMPQFSDVCEVVLTEKVGRQVLARKPIQVGDYILNEKSFASALFSDFATNHCSHCFSMVIAPFPCIQCSSVVYCDNSCREEAWNESHHLECGWHGSLSEPWLGKMGHLAIRTALVAGWSVVSEFGQWDQHVCEGKPFPGCEQNGGYHGGYHALRHLVSHDDKRDPTENLQLCLLAMILAKIMFTMSYTDTKEKKFPNKDRHMKIDSFELDSNDNAVISSKAVPCRLDAYENTSVWWGLCCYTLLHHLQILQSNCHNITEMTKPKTYLQSQPVSIGLGIYPACALLNHSCDPNTELIFYKNTCVTRALKNINPGEEVCFDYGPLFFLQSRAERQNRMRTEYFFTCDCRACHNDWPLWEHVNSTQPMFQCNKCGYSLEVDTANSTMKALCPHCDIITDLNSYMTQLEKSHDQYTAAMEQARAGELAEALPILESHLVLMQKLLVQPWRDFLSCQAAIRQCYRLMGNLSLD